MENEQILSETELQAQKDREYDEKMEQMEKKFAKKGKIDVKNRLDFMEKMRKNEEEKQMKFNEENEKNKQETLEKKKEEKQGNNVSEDDKIEYYI